MGQFLKIIAIGWVALMIAVLANKYLEPSSARDMAAYQAKYEELNNKEQITEQDKQELDALFQRLNAMENIKADLIEVIIKYGLFFALFIPLTIWVARSIRLDTNHILIAAALIFTAFIVMKSVVSGAIFATTFVIAGTAFSKHPPPRQDSDQHNMPE